MNEADRMSRASHYVFGLMDDAERERAERDLERDAGFRDAVLRVSVSVHRVSDPSLTEPGIDTRWRSVSAQLGELPHMRGIAPIGLRISQRERAAASKSLKWWFHPIRKTWINGAALAAAFALGYLAGLFS